MKMDVTKQKLFKLQIIYDLYKKQNLIKIFVIQSFIMLL